MMKKKQITTEVLITGASPVGLMTAILLAEAGIDAQLIDLAHMMTSLGAGAGAATHS